MTILKTLATACALLTAITALAQTTRQEMAATPAKNGGVYYPYPVTERIDTPAPKGYTPFYVSHYGRHGSRYLIADRDYSEVMQILIRARSAGALTELGRDVADRLDSVWIEAHGRGGELSPLGNRQHRAIAQRLYKAVPLVFQPAKGKNSADQPVVTATSTVVMRCAHSMFAFIEALKELNPQLVIPRESGERTMVYMNYHSPESSQFNNHNSQAHFATRNFRKAKTQPDRLMASLFSDSAYVRNHIDADDLMWKLYWVAVDMPNMETPISFFDIFTADELFDLWQVFNFDFYSHNSSYPPAQGAFTDNARNLVINIVDSADHYVSAGRRGATLRFGHDGNIIPLAALLQLEGAVAWQSDPGLLYKEYTDFKISPMAANIQMILYRNPSGDVIAKFMLNEREVHIPIPTDMFPYYKWDDARAWLKRVADTPSAEFIPAGRRVPAQ